MTDPRATNCQAFHLNAAGQVDGVELTVVPVPAAQYVCKSVSMVDEGAAQGQITAQVLVYDKAGFPVMGAKVYLAWPWTGGAEMANRALPGNTNYPPNHVISNGYNPPARGPLAIYVGHADGSVNSEVVGGLGLPNNRHVSFNLMFQERNTDAPPVEPPVTAPGCLAWFTGLFKR